MNTHKEVKKFHQVKFQQELEQLNNAVKYVIESNAILLKLESETIEDFELKIKEKSGFVSAILSAEAYGYSDEYKRLLELEKLIENKLSINDLNNGEIKKSVIDRLRLKHTEFLTDEEVQTKKKLSKILKLYNDLAPEEKNHIGFNRQQNLVFNPFSFLI